MGLINYKMCLCHWHGNPTLADKQKYSHYMSAYVLCAVVLHTSELAEVEVIMLVLKMSSQKHVSEGQR